MIEYEPIGDSAELAHVPYVASGKRVRGESPSSEETCGYGAQPGSRAFPAPELSIVIAALGVSLVDDLERSELARGWGGRNGAICDVTAQPLVYRA